MATSVGQINFGVGVDASGVASQLTRDLAPALKRVQAELDRKPLKVKATIDTTKALNEAKLALKRADLSVKIDAKVDLDKSQVAALRELSKLGDKNANVKINLDMDQQKLAQLEKIAPALRALRSLTSKDVKIKIDIEVDEEKLARVAASLKELHNKTVRTKVDADTSGAEAGTKRVDNNLKALQSTATRVGGLSLSFGKWAATLAAIGGAAGVAAGAVGGLLAAAGAVGPAFAGIGATAVVGLHGIKDAFSALKDISANSAADARTQTQAVAAAQVSLTSATDSASDAVRSLADAQSNSADAAKGVAAAYKTAQERLDGYTLSLQEANLNEKDAQLNLAEAQQKLAAGGFKTSLEQQRAVLAVQRAQVDLTKAQQAGTKLQNEANQAQQAGIDQAPEVLAAKKQQHQADEQLADAQRNVVRTSEAVARAADELAKAQGGAGTSSEKFADALANLAPNAQAFVLAAKGIAPELSNIGKATQDALFANLGNDLKTTATAVLPAFKTGLADVATQLNLVAQGAFQFAASADGVKLVNGVFADTSQLLKGMQENSTGFGSALTATVNAITPQMAGLGSAISEVGKDLSTAFADSANSGQLSSVVAGFSDALRGVGPLLNGLVSGLLTIADKVMPTLGPFFTTLGEQLTKIAPSLGDLGATFVNALTPILPVLGDLIKDLATNLAPILPVISTILISLGQAIQPLLPVFSQIAQTIGGVLADTIKALAPALPPLAKAFGDLLNAVAPLIPLFANNLAVVIEALAPALSTLFNALAPVIKQFAEQMAPVFKELAPVLAQVAGTIAQALVTAIQAIAPLLPDLAKAFANLIASIAPFIPQLIDLAVQFIPPVVDILKVLIPVLTTVIDTFTWLVNNVISPILIPALQLVTASFQDMFNRIGDAVDWAMKNVFPRIQDVLHSIQGWFSDTVDAVGKSWSQLMDVAAQPVNFVIDTVWNKGLLKAWSSVDSLLGGVLPDASPLPLIPARATGGPLNYFGSGGSGNGTKDDILFWGSNNEHVITASEVMKAGGQNIIYAIRDMIARGIPFTWDNGKLVTDLGKSNLDAYGAQVAAKGIGNVPPEGLFDSLIPRHATGGQIFPWMYQLQKGHDFAKAQDGKPYQWAGPRFVGDSFDCSGFMGSIVAAILGDNPWQRYWSTSSFAGYPQIGAQGLTRNLTDGSGMAIGITDDPGGPGGGHTAGELRGIPELGIAAARVESGGSIGDVHYGRGTDPNTFAALYGLPIGANGFFQPTPGGSSNGGPIGPSTDTQKSFLHKTIEKMLKAYTTPLRASINASIGSPPPSQRAIPGAVLDGISNGIATVGDNYVGTLGSLLGGAWQTAQSLGDNLLSLNPFDSGGIASGVGFLPKNIIEPERVLSPDQTKMFEALVTALGQLASGGAKALSQAAAAITVDISKASVDALKTEIGPTDIKDELAKTNESIDRTATSAEAARAIDQGKTNQALLDISNALSVDVLGPILSSAWSSLGDVFGKLVDGLGKDIVGAVNGTTTAVDDLNNTVTAQGDQVVATPAFGMPGSAFDLTSALSDGVKSISEAAGAAFKKVADDVVNAALKQTPSNIGSESRGVLGKDISGGFLTDFLVQLTGVEIQVRDLLSNTLEQVKAFRGDQFKTMNSTGQLISDTAALVDRNQSSFATAAAEQQRQSTALIKAALKYLVSSVIIPVLTAVLSAMITIATTAIGAAIGSAIPVIGTAIGAAIGAAVGAGLSGLASTFIGLLAVGVGGALSAFDSGGVANGVGFMPKNTVAPERVLSPRQTTAFETLVGVLDRGTAGGNRTVQVGSMNLYGAGAPEKAADSLLRLLNT